MLRNYLAIAIRSLQKHKTFSLINIIGLGISMSVCLVIIIIVIDQYSYDLFHEKGDRIVRINTTEYDGDVLASSPKNIIDVIGDYNVAENKILITNAVGGDVKYNESIVPLAGYFANGDFLQSFSFPLIAGNPNNALEGTRSIVLTKAASDKIFGVIDPLGKIIRLNDRGIMPLGITVNKKSTDLGEFTVTGVLDLRGLKTHMKFDYLISLPTLEALVDQNILTDISDSWTSYYINYNYVVLKEGKTKNDLKDALQQISTRFMTNEEDPNKSARLTIQPLSEITPGNIFGNMMSLRMPKIGLQILMGLALVVMLSACFNYTNLSVARAVARAREIGIRKSMGAEKRQIFQQFILEAVIISLISLLFAFFLLQLIAPAFSSLWFNKYLQLELNTNLLVYVAFIFFGLLIGILAGFLPSLYLSKFNPLDVIKGKSNLKVFKKINLRKALIVSQFCLSLFFISIAVTIHFQQQHVNEVQYGYETESIINVPIYDINLNAFKSQLLSNPDIRNVTAMQYVLASGVSHGTRFFPKGLEEESVNTNYVMVDPNYIETYDIHLLEGRFFDYSMESKNEKYIVITEDLVSSLGYDSPKEAIGKYVLMRNAFSEEGKVDSDVQIIGVIENIQHRLLFDPTQSGLTLRFEPESLNFASIRVGSTNREQTHAFIKNTWQQFDQTHLFEYEYLDDHLDSTYSIMNDISAIIGFFSLLAISIACLGLLGMVVYITENRVREVGIRKAMGATENQLIYLLSKGFIKLLAISILITLPLAWLLNNSWLEFFSSHINFGVKIIGITIGVMLLLGIAMIVPQTWKSSRVNPVDVLKED